MELEAVLRAVGFEPSSAAPPASSSSAHGADNSRNRPPSLAHGAENLEDVSIMPVAPRGGARGPRPLHATERLEHGGFHEKGITFPESTDWEFHGLDLKGTTEAHGTRRKAVG
jgi:hypothetical protein